MTAKHRQGKTITPFSCDVILDREKWPIIASMNPRVPRRTGVHVDTLIKRSQYLATDALARARMETT